MINTPLSSRAMLLMKALFTAIKIESVIRSCLETVACKMTVN